MPDASLGKLGFAVGDLGQDNTFTRHARSLNAAGFGVVSFESLPGGTGTVDLWTQTPTDTVMTVAGCDRQPNRELQHLIAGISRFTFRISQRSPPSSVSPGFGLLFGRRRPKIA